MKGSKHHPILFTGGLDSSYRFCQLAQHKNVVIEPIYIINKRRPETEREIIAQKNIYEYIVNHHKTKATILPINRIPQEQLPKETNYQNIEKALGKYGLGWQFIDIGLYSMLKNELEICQEEVWEKFPKETEFFVKNNRTYMDTSLLNIEIQFLFKNLTFPIIGVTRKQMISDLKKWGYYEIIDKIWFCYQNINGKPCGICDNCRKKITDGLSFLFDKEGQKRFLIYRFIYTYHPYVSLFYYHEYLFNRKNCAYDVIPEGYADKQDESKKRDWFFDKFRKLENLSAREIKQMIITANFNPAIYGLRKGEYWEKRLEEFRNDEERKKKLTNYFKGINV